MHNIRNTIYFKGINGLRAIAAVSVLFAHITSSLKEFGLNNYIFGQYPDGSPKSTLLAGFGVSIFFSISGFLITFLLLQEKLNGTISIRKFYIRRVLRIWPLYFIYLFICLIIILIFKFEFELSSLLFYTFMSANIPFIFGNAIQFAHHYWSLGVEEQFYLFWPHFVNKFKKILTVSTLLCITLIVFKLSFYWVSKTNPSLNKIYTFIHATRFQCMLIGGIGAILYFQKNALFLKLVNTKLLQLVSWGAIFLMGINKFHLISVLDNEIVSIITLFLIIGQIEIKNRIVNLENKFFDFLGKISFGIYIIHPLLIFFLSKQIKVEAPTIYSYFFVFTSIILSTILFAWISYKYIEQPILKYKAKFTTIKSKSSIL